MTRKVIAVLLIFCLACSSIFAFGIGVQGASDIAGYARGYYDSTGIDITFKLDSIPLVFAAGIPHFYNPFALGISADYWILNPSIASSSSWSLNWFVGAGIFADFFMPRNDFYLGIGARLPIGLNIFFLRNILEGYLQAAPGFELEIGSRITPVFVFPIAYGIRFWIRLTS